MRDSFRKNSFASFESLVLLMIFSADSSLVCLLSTSSTTPNAPVPKSPFSLYRDSKFVIYYSFYFYYRTAS